MRAPKGSREISRKGGFLDDSIYFVEMTQTLLNFS